MKGRVALVTAMVVCTAGIVWWSSAGNLCVPEEGRPAATSSPLHRDMLGARVLRAFAAAGRQAQPAQQQQQPPPPPPRVVLDREPRRPDEVEVRHEWRESFVAAFDDFVDATRLPDERVQELLHILRDFQLEWRQWEETAEQHQRSIPPAWEVEEQAIEWEPSGDPSMDFERYVHALEDAPPEARGRGYWAHERFLAETAPWRFEMYMSAATRIHDALRPDERRAWFRTMERANVWFLLGVLPTLALTSDGDRDD